MNREIKFRAWDKEINQYRSSGTIQISSDGKPFVLSPLDNGSGFLFERLKNIIIEQFTGLTDKNGKEIYEGDIIKNARGDWGVIVWKSPFFETTVSENQSSLYSKEYYLESEIIGNIYENPELLIP